jgi:glycosyltransferase involved in cell wall biosynthesis
VTTLRVIVEDIVAPPVGEASGYARALTKSLIETAPPGAVVEGVIAASPEDDYAMIATELPGLGRLAKSALAHNELRAAWRSGVVGLIGGGMVHAPSLLSPLYRHDRLHKPGEQLVVTIHDTLAWTAPGALASSTASWTRAMAKRAERHADAIVVPSHAVASELAGLLNLGERIRVIPGAPRLWPTRSEPDELDLPERYVVAVARLGARDEYGEFATAVSRLGAGPLQVIVPAGVTAPEQADGLHVWSDPSPAVQRALLAGARVYVDPVPVEGGAGWLLEALASGAPAVHAATPGLTEQSSGSSIGVAVDGEDFAGLLAEAVEALLTDLQLAERLRIAGLDRARAFTWRDAAEKVWQLHADL